MMGRGYEQKQFKKTYVDRDLAVLVTISWYPVSPDKWVVRSSIKKGPLPEWHIGDKGDWAAAEMHVESILREQGYSLTSTQMFTKTDMIVMVFKEDPEKNYEKQSVLDLPRIYVPLLPILHEEIRITAKEILGKE